MNTVWFKRKTFGWGWVPATWQGWVVTVLYAICTVSLAFIFDRYAPERAGFLFALGIVILTALLIWIAWKKGEKPRWQWGREIEKK